MENNALYFTEVTCMVDAPPRLRFMDNREGGKTYDLYPVTVFCRERDLFNQDRIRTYATLLAYPASDELILRPGRTIGGRITDIDWHDGTRPVNALRDLHKNSMFKLDALGEGRFSEIYSPTMPGAPELPFKTRAGQALERAFRRNGKWLGTPLKHHSIPQPPPATVLTFRTPTPDA